MKVILAVYTLLIISIFSGFSQEKKHIIIDTDCAMDDLRAISLLLSRPEIEVEGIIASCGSLDPQTGAKKLLSLLSQFRLNITVAFGNEIKGVNPVWREFNKTVYWGEEIQLNNVIPTANKLFAEVLNAANEEITLVCLSNLNALAYLKKSNPELLKKIDEVIWYNDSYKPLAGVNYEWDKKSADEILDSDIKLTMISNLDKPQAKFTDELLKTAEMSNTPQGRIIFKSHNTDVVKEKMKTGEAEIWDELTVIYLLYNEAFEIQPDLSRIKKEYCVSYNADIVYEIYKDLINGIFNPEKSVVFNSFPVDKSLYMYDVREIMDSAIMLYGMDEWKACALTDEFHGHLGIFSLVGAKMGILAREYFGVGVDKLTVLSYAGFRPPYSCMNDGLQVSTGATLGQGTITVSNDSIKYAMADFSYKGKTIRIRLRDEYIKVVDRDIENALAKYSLSDQGYWELVRSNAIKHWLDWNRKDIFELEIIK
ncbi:MAG: hypothetical protein A2W91_10170 [Bacteroidetes bacterium GWF2_38_335]|nr:MAG: hypothetical protein A2W91_10170 [Bacteroidetes bacterium GWF2_38_335]HBS88010.1 hypothetical protein [Bacteroidales bacterium]